MEQDIFEHMGADTHVQTYKSASQMNKGKAHSVHAV